MVRRHGKNSCFFCCYWPFHLSLWHKRHRKRRLTSFLTSQKDITNKAPSFRTCEGKHPRHLEKKTTTFPAKRRQANSFPSLGFSNPFPRLHRSPLVRENLTISLFASRELFCCTTFVRYLGLGRWAKLSYRGGVRQERRM